MPRVPQGSVKGPLLFIIYINDLPDGINSLCKIFADDTLLFSKFYDIKKSLSELKVGLSPSKKICVNWFIESPLKMMKNAFYFILKALFVLKIFKFLS